MTLWRLRAADINDVLDFADFQVLSCLIALFYTLHYTVDPRSLPAITLPRMLTPAMLTNVLCCIFVITTFLSAASVSANSFAQHQGCSSTRQTRHSKLAERGSPYWLASIGHNGLSPYNSDSSYTIYRNVQQ